MRAGRHLGAEGKVTVGKNPRRQLSRKELDSLESFRAIARQIRESSVIDSGITYTVSISFDPETGLVHRSDVPEEQFKALSTAVRKVLLTKDHTDFGRVCNIVKRYAPNLRMDVDSVHDRFKNSYQQGPFEMVEGGKKIDPVEVFDDWLNGIQFHSDVEKRNRYESRRQHAGPVIDWVVQRIAFSMAGRILDLDDLVADFLDEPKLARI